MNILQRNSLCKQQKISNFLPKDRGGGGISANSATPADPLTRFHLSPAFFPAEIRFAMIRNDPGAPSGISRKNANAA